MTRLLSIFLFNWIILFALIGLISCKDTQTSPSSEIVFPDDSVSYTKHVGPLLQQKCASSPCHGGSRLAADLNLEYPNYSMLINRPGLVIPGDANHSVLFQEINGTPPLMPPSKFPQLTTNQINGIKTWINEGVKFN
jgi:hypothetical protein